MTFFYKNPTFRTSFTYPNGHNFYSGNNPISLVNNPYDRANSISITCLTYPKPSTELARFGGQMILPSALHQILQTEFD